MMLTCIIILLIIAAIFRPRHYRGFGMHHPHGPFCGRPPMMGPGRFHGPFDPMHGPGGPGGPDGHRGPGGPGGHGGQGRW